MEFDVDSIDPNSLSKEQIMVLKAKLRLGKRELKYYQDTMKYFTHPELRLKCFDTVQWERDVPKLEELLSKLK